MPLKLRPPNSFGVGGLIDQALTVKWYQIIHQVAVLFGIC